MNLWLDTVDFENRGEWQVETQFVREMGQGYLIALNTPGVPVKDASTGFEVSKDGYYRFFARTKNWKIPESPGKFNLKIDGKSFGNILGARPIQSWYFETAGDIFLKKGKHTLALHDNTGWLSRCSAVLITDDFDFVPSPEVERLYKTRNEWKGIDGKIISMPKYDFIVVGAGPGGVPSAVAAARNGLKTALICSRPYIGGNSSNEGTIGYDGAASYNPGWHESGIMHEIKRIREHHIAGGEKNYDWQEALYELTSKQKNLDIYENCLCIDANTEKGRILSITCIDTFSLIKSEFSADVFADCSGDGWLGYYAGAKYRVGREAKHEAEEKFAPEITDDNTMSGCTCGKEKGVTVRRGFGAEKTDKKVVFKCPKWAVHFPKGDKLEREPVTLNTASWWLENDNGYDDLFEEEFVRDELVRLSVGYFDWMKNSWSGKAEMENHKLTYISLHNSKRENRRLIGDYILTQNDYDGKAVFDDTVAYSGWNLDVHHIKGVFSGKGGAFSFNERVPLTPIPFRCLYSKNIDNLMFASRCGSFSHIALGTTRVEATLALCGQAVGTAAYIIKKYTCTPRDVYKSHITELKQTLMKDDVTILGEMNEDENDFARLANVRATSYEGENKPENVINGYNRALGGKTNAWVSLSPLPQELFLKLDKTRMISSVQLTLDTDLTLPRFSYIEAPEYPGTVSDFVIYVKTGGKWKEIEHITDNYLRFIRVKFRSIPASEVKIKINKAVKCDVAKIIEVRIY